MISADSPWKEVCERKLALVFDLLYPRVHRELDWTQDYEALDQELRKFAPASKAGGRIADRLIKALARGSGDPRYFHLEVQGKKERGFRRRIHLCNLRAEERFNSHVVSMVVLTDENLTWRPGRYVAGLFPVQGEPPDERAASSPGGRKRRRYLDERTLRFLTVKLIDFRGREAELEALENPMGLFVVAHLEAMRTRDDAPAREQAKLRLIRNLRQRKMDLEDARLWLACLDWFLQLPEQRERALAQELERQDREENMPYLSFIERDALEKGLEQGLEKGTEKGRLEGRLAGRLETLRGYLKAKFGEEALAWLSAVERISDEAQLADLCERVFKADTGEQVRALLLPPGDNATPPT
jgi:hypothetical protein